MNTLEFRRLGMQARRMLREKLGRPTKRYFRHRVDEYRRIWGLAAEACGAELLEVAADLWRVERDGIGVFVRSGEIQLDDPVTLIMAGRKALMHRLLSEAGLQVPVHRVFGLEDLGPALELLERFPRGVVVKPASGTAAGDGVSTHITTTRGLGRAAVLASLYDRELLVEEQVQGESYRALVVGGRLLHVVCRRGPRATADGGRTVRQLIAAQNRGRIDRGEAPIEVDADCVFTLAWQGLTMDSVPPDGMEVLLRAVENPEGGTDEIRTVYNAVVTEQLCPPVRAAVERAAAVLGSDLVGVDFITTDPARALVDSGGCINEVNTTPALHHHYDPTMEAYPAVAVDVLELALLRKRQRSDPFHVQDPARAPADAVRDRGTG